MILNNRVENPPTKRKKGYKMAKCPVCGEEMTLRGLTGHMRFKHPDYKKEASKKPETPSKPEPTESNDIEQPQKKRLTFSLKKALYDE